MASGSENIAPDTTNAQESQVTPIPSHLAFFNAILRALLQIDVFKDELSKDEEVRTGLSRFLVPKIVSPSGRSVDNITGIFGIYGKIMIELPFLRTLGEISKSVNKTCYRCNSTMDDFQNTAGEIIAAGYLKELKSMFKEFKFETIFRIAKVAKMIPCLDVNCKENNIVERKLNKLPSIFALALGWHYNEGETYIRDSLSVLEARIDLSGIYKYEGDSKLVNYDLVSMVCTQQDHETQEKDQYMCFYVANERGKWVRLVGAEEEQITIGEDWKSVVCNLAAEYIRPEILFFEQVKVSIPPSTSSVVPKPTEASSSSADLKGKGILMD